MINVDDVTVVVRTVGERTTQRCCQILEEQFRQDQVNLVVKRPFTAALRRTYEIGIESNRPWLLTVDADVLPDRDMMMLLLDGLPLENGRFFSVLGQVRDKLLMCRRLGGIRFYRASLLPMAMRVDCEDSIRPEYETVRGMRDQGRICLERTNVVGMHDYHQYYRDIFRKAAHHWYKHQRIIKRLRSRWEGKAKDDADFRVALAGAACAGDGWDFLDAATFPRIDVLLDELSLEEKGELKTL